MEYKKHINQWITVIWLIFICVAGYFVFRSLPIDFFTWRDINYFRVSLAISTGLVGSLPLVWVVHDYLVKKSWQVSFILTFLPAIAKYIPGKIWTFLGFVLQARNMVGISEKDASFFQVYNQLISMLASVILVIGSISIVNFFKGSRSLSHFNIGAVVLFLVSIIMLYFFIRIAEKYKHAIEKYRVFCHVVALSFQKILKGLSLALFVSAFTPVQGFVFEIVLAFVIAAQIGIFAFFAPAGLGVTESAYVLLLSEPFTLATAVQIAIFARVWQIILDVLLFVASFILKLCYFREFRA